LHVAGDLKVVGVQNLGGLGDKEGPPVTYTYTMPNILPELVPWIAILLLLLVKSNRLSQAWLIWLPLLCVGGMRYALQRYADFLPSELPDSLCQVVTASAFGVAALCLMAPQTKREHGFFTLLAVLFCLEMASLIFFLVSNDWDSDFGETFVFTIFLLIMNAVIVLSMFVSSIACRKKFAAFRVLFWSIGSILVFCILLSVPFAVLPLLFARGEFPWGEVAKAVLLMAGVTLIPIVPFLLLSFFSSYFRERLQLLLHRSQHVLPPVLSETAPLTSVT
jgi:hypothetical protein